MRAARALDTSHHADAPRQAPAPSPTEEPVLRPAAEHHAAAASPVHAMQAKLVREYNEGLSVPLGRRRIDPVNVAVVLAALLYTVAFWSGLIAVATTWMHHLAAR